EHNRPIRFERDIEIHQMALRSIINPHLANIRKDLLAVVRDPVRSRTEISIDGAAHYFFILSVDRLAGAWFFRPEILAIYLAVGEPQSPMVRVIFGHLAGQILQLIPACYLISAQRQL